MRSMRMMQVPAYQVIHVVTMRNRFMATALTMLMIAVMIVTLVIRSAIRRIATTNF